MAFNTRYTLVFYSSKAKAPAYNGRGFCCSNIVMRISQVFCRPETY